MGGLHEDFIARLAALVPRPRAHLLRYHGLFIPGILPSTLRVSLRLLKIAPGDFVSPNAPKRRLIVKSSLSRTRANATYDDPPPRTPMSWMARLRRVFDIDISRCPVCNGTLRVIAVVTEPVAIGRIIEHLNRRGKDPPRQAAPVVH